MPLNYIPWEEVSSCVQQCTICFQPNLINLVRPVAEGCVHIFHEICLLKWIERAKRGKELQTYFHGGTRSRPDKTMPYIGLAHYRNCPVCSKKYSVLKISPDQLSKEQLQIVNGPKRKIKKEFLKALAVPPDVKLPEFPPQTSQTPTTPPESDNNEYKESNAIRRQVFLEAKERRRLKLLERFVGPPQPSELESDVTKTPAAPDTNFPEAPVLEFPVSAFICHVCHKEFTDTGTKSKHLKTHLKKVKCKVCGKKLAHRSLPVHMKSQHSKN